MNKDIERIKGIVLSQGSTDPKGGKVLKIEVGKVAVLSRAKERLYPVALRIYQEELQVLFVNKRKRFFSYPLLSLQSDTPKLFEKVMTVFC